MIRFLFISAFCGGLALQGHSQPITVWIEQLAALQTLHNTVQQGYAAITGGLQIVGDTRYKEFQLHESYFAGFDTVKPVIDDDPRVQALRVRLDSLVVQLRSALDYWQGQPILSP